MTFRNILFYLFLTLIYSCASIKPPSGGDVDEIPPTIFTINPQNGTINLETRKVVIKFSEFMDENSFKNGINIFPQLSSPLELKFHGDEIILILPDSLDNEKTYIISLNRNIKDEHGIQLAKTSQLAYSTGDKISKGMIIGKTYAANPVSIHLWKITDSKIDSIFATPPDYVTDVNQDMTYSFAYLSPGEYQVLAVDKSASGLPLNTERSGYGLYWGNTLNLIDDDTLSNINMRLWKEPQDLKALRGEWSAFNWGRLFFNNELNNNISAEINVKTEDGTEIDSLHYYLDPIDNKNLIVQLQNISEQKSLEINIESIKLNDATLLDTARLIIQIQQESDTSYLEILEPTANFKIFPNNIKGDALKLNFSKPVKLSADSTLLPELFRNDSIPVSLNIKQVNPMQIELIPKASWEENAKYKLQIFREGLLVDGGRGLQDSIKTITLTTGKAIGYGTVSGKIMGTDNINIIVELFSTKNPSLSHSALVNSQSKFEFKTIPEGNYSLYLFEDNDKNMKYSFGKAYQNTPSEWFFFYPDTFEVRANWDTEIAPIKLPEKK